MDVECIECNEHSLENRLCLTIQILQSVNLKHGHHLPYDVLCNLTSHTNIDETKIVEYAIKTIFEATCLCEKSSTPKGYDEDTIFRLRSLLMNHHDLFVDINNTISEGIVYLPIVYGNDNYQIVQQVGIEKMLIKLYNKQHEKGFVKKMSGILFRNAYMLATEIPSAVTAGALSIFAKSNWDPKEPITDKSRLPILFIHGLKHNQSGWYAGSELLNWHDKDNQICGSFYFISYDCVITNSWDKAIDDYVAIISGKVASIRAETGHQNVILIGHSLGGIIASRYAETHTDAKHVITIGSPFKGSHVASLMKSQKEKFGMDQRVIDNELVEGSESLEKIRLDAEKSDWNGTIKYYNIRSTTDKLVPKSSTLVTKDPRRVFTMESTGHIGLLFMPKCWSKIYEWLSEIHDSLEVNIKLL